MEDTANVKKLRAWVEEVKSCEDELAKATASRDALVYKLYIEEDLSLRDIAAIVKHSPEHVRKLIAKLTPATPQPRNRQVPSIIRR